jgi:class 3 adenylate cyclase/predicted ATPase
VAAIQQLNKSDAPATGEVRLQDSDTNPVPPGQVAERRHLTVLFVDLVGSTELSRRLDPEDLRDVMRRYQDAVADCIARYDGHLAKFLGDGVLAYFGWPQAYEDQTERAVRSGLDAVAAIAGIEIQSGSMLRGRVGIATGEVVIGDIIGEASAEAGAVVGETPNIAARLQTLAEPGQVVIGSTTRRLIGDQFDCRDLGVKPLKGIAEPMPAWQVLGARAVESRFEAAHAGKLTGLVGREHELGLLLERWTLAKGGEGQVVVLSGEAGIGKSRMVQALREHVRDQPHFHLRYQCSSYHSNSAFYPIVHRLERAAGFSAEDTADVKLDRLENLVALTAEDIGAVAPCFAALLSVPGDDRYGPLELSPQQLRTRLIEMLIDQLLALGRQRPVLFVLEDAHWIDPTTEDLVGEIMPLIADKTVFMLITYRPSYAPPWAGHPHLTSVVLNRLGRKQGAEIVRSVGGATLKEAVVERIIARAGGVPLYVEEITKSVVEAVASGEEGQAEDRIPATLQGSLVARLDRLGDAKEIAQMGAVIGREFSYALLAAIAETFGVEVDAGLDRLVRSELALRRGTPPNATFTFKHALVQDAAYKTLLRSRRAQVHRRIAEVLENRFPDTAETEPELLAHHYTEAGLTEPAVIHWQRAGKRAFERSANAEAVSHLTTALALLATMPESRDRDRSELALQIDIGLPLLATKGLAAPEVAETYKRARQLCDAVGDTSQIFPVTWGLWYSMNQTGRIDEALSLADELIDIGQRQGDSGLLLEAHHAAWTSSLVGRDLNSVRTHAENGIALYDSDQHHIQTFHYGGHDPGVCCRFVNALAMCLLGFPDQARDLARDSVTLAERLGHQFSLALALSFTSSVYLFRRETQPVRDQAKALTTLCDEHGFAHFSAMAPMLEGWALAAQGDAVHGIALMEKGLDAVREAGVKRLSFQLAILGEACAWAGEIGQGLEVIDQAEKNVEETGERRWEAEVFRLKGRLLSDGPDADIARAEAAYMRAIDVARKQQAKWFELRAATDLALLWSNSGRGSEAHALLAPTFDWFTEGFDTANLKEAKALLEKFS